jgi:hypothetical protein
MPPRAQHVVQETSPTSESFHSVEEHEQSALALSRSKGKAKAKSVPLDADGKQIVLVGNLKDDTVVPLALLRSVYLNEPFARDKIALASDHRALHSTFPRRTSSSVVDLDLSELWSEAQAVVYRPASSFVRYHHVLGRSNAAYRAHTVIGSHLSAY